MIRGDGGHLVGVDIGAHKVQTLVTDLTGTAVAFDRRPTASTDGPHADALLGKVRKSIDSALRRAGVDLASVRAMGVGMPGDIDPSTGEVALAPQIQGFEGLRLRELMQGWFPCPVFVDNEVHLAVLGERWRGVAKGVDDAVLINAGIGVAAGILIGGKLHRGANGAAGEIGYLPLVEDWSSSRPPGGWGALEYSAGGAAFERLGREAFDSEEAAILRELTGDTGVVDAKRVFQAARRGDVASRRIVDQLLALLARAIASVVLVLDPSMVVIAGGLARAGAELLDPLAERVRALVPMNPRIVLTALGDDAVSVGAIYVAHQSAWAEVRLSPFDDVPWRAE